MAFVIGFPKREAEGMIELKRVSKVYGGLEVIPEMDLSIAAGKTTALIGPSGCGKSTLLRLMIGLVRPDSGTITIEGEELTPATALEVRRGLGYVTQDGGLFPHLSARENVALMARYLGWDRTRIETRLNDLAELTHFPADGLDRFPAQLSGGQKQRQPDACPDARPEGHPARRADGCPRPHGPGRAPDRPAIHLPFVGENRRDGDP